MLQMLVDDRDAFALESQAASRTAALLLHSCMAALLACIIVGAAIYLYWTFSGVVSTYRRQLHAAAHEAQNFFDRRAALLRSISASAVRDTLPLPSSAAPGQLDVTAQANILPLQDESGMADWALVLTWQDLRNIAHANASLLYRPARGARSVLQIAHGPRAPPAIDPQTLQWLAQTLTAAEARIGTGWPVPILWLRYPKTGSPQQLFLFMPLDPASPQPSWIGLMINGEDAAAEISRTAGGSYVLFDKLGGAMLHSPDTDFTDGAFSHAFKQDSAGLHGRGALPELLALINPVGADGWRLVFQKPLRQFLEQSLTAVQTTGLVSLLLSFAVIVLVRYIRRRFVLPALRHHAALADAAALNRQLIEAAPVGLFLLRSSDGSLVLSNHSARRWFQDTPGWRSRIPAFLGDRGGREHELADGRSVHLAFSPTLFRGEPAALGGISDISALKTVERTLRQAKREAQAANQAKTDFLGRMSHEVRSPLYGILGSLELFSLAPASGQQTQYLDAIRQSSATLLRTINETLDLARIETGHAALEVVTFSPVTLVHDVVAGFAARAHSKGLHSYAVVDPNTPDAVIGDAPRIRQILDNLFSNAIKFTASGRIALRLTVARISPHGVDLSFQVADTGQGIAPENLARLFEPFYQVDGDNPARAYGSGLGLTICRRLSNMMNGKLQAVSELGLGTSITFGVRLAIATATDETAPFRLDDTIVYVRGAVPEVVANMRGWLCRWGARAMTYPKDGVLPRGIPQAGSAVLIQTWPPALESVNWSGPRVVIHPPGLKPYVDEGGRRWFASTGSLASIGHAVRLAQGGASQPLLDGPKARPDPLSLRLLVVEDNPINRLVLREQLDHLGCNVTLAVNGCEALALPELMGFDAVLTDLRMPLVDGCDLARALRQRGFEKFILGVTANAFPEERQRAMDAGMNALLVKPLSVAILKQALQAAKALQGNGVRT